jgi:MinD superfamily P-loop ATPase
VTELVIISGKGGPGKTSITASFGHLARDNVMADCDVDAADLHILADPDTTHEEDFLGGVLARIDPEQCTECGACYDACRFDAISKEFVVDPIGCEGCAVCFHVCPADAVVLEEPINGRWFISDTRFGPMVHAALLPGAENSGKLVALVRNQAKVLARKKDKSLIIVDGAPGVGCPVISSVTGADHVLIVTEPTLSGMHDMDRAIELVKGFNVPMSVIINKHDINSEVTSQIESFVANSGVAPIGKIPFDPAIVEAMVQKRCVSENGETPAGRSIQEIWLNIERCVLS